MPAPKPSGAPLAALRRLADRILEAHDLAQVARLLMESVPEALGVASVALLVWNRKLDAFEALTPGQTQALPVRSEGPAIPTPAARYLIADGQLIETPGGSGQGALLPLMARAGLTGMLVLGPLRGRRKRPYNRAELRGLDLVASRAALSLEHFLYQRELIASERMAALGSMAGMLAHDFRGPMTVIRGYAETIADGGLPQAEVQQRARAIMQMVDRLDRMTGETLDYARGGGKLAARPLDASRFVGELVRGLELEEPGLTVLADVQLPEGLVLTLDADKLRRAAGNLGHNAAEAMKGRGRLHVSARLEAASPPAVAALLVLTFRDEGPGVPEEIRERVFEPFVTAGKKHGTGLGLAVARRFVEDHGGRLSLLPGGPGACFRMELPVVAGDGPR